MLPIYLVFSAAGMRGKGTVAACGVATLILAAKVHAEHRRRAWFWTIMLAAAVAIALLVAYIPISNKDYALPLVLPFGCIEYWLITVCIRLTDKK